MQSPMMMGQPHMAFPIPPMPMAGSAMPFPPPGMPPMGGAGQWGLASAQAPAHLHVSSLAAEDNRIQ